METEHSDVSSGNTATECIHTELSSTAADDNSWPSLKTNTATPVSRDQHGHLNSPPTKSSAVNTTSTNGETQAPPAPFACKSENDAVGGSDSLATGPMVVTSPINTTHDTLNGFNEARVKIEQNTHLPTDKRPLTDWDVASEEEEEVIVEAGGVARRGAETVVQGTFAINDGVINPNSGTSNSHQGNISSSKENGSPPEQNRGVVASLPSNARVKGNKPREILVTNSGALEMNGRPEFDLGYFIYNPSQLLPSFIEKENSVFDVCVPAVFLTYENLKVRRRALWGTDVYTDDSDVVAMAVHMGKYIPSFPGPLSSKEAQPTQEIPDHDLRIRLRVLPKLLRYTGCTRHRIKSRDWGDHDGVSLKVENVTLMPLGAATDLGRKNQKRRIDEHNLARKRIMASPELDHMLHHYASGAVVKDGSLVFHKQLDLCWKYTRPW